MAFDLSSKAALVVGATDRLGRSVAVALAEAGADVVVTGGGTGGEAAEVQAVADEIRALGRRSSALELDVTRSSDVDAAVAGVLGELGRLDILVNNQDLVLGKPAAETTDAEWSQVLAVNLTGAFNTMRAAGAAMLSRGSGRIVNICSMLGERGMANSAAYCAAKAGVVNLTRALSAEWCRNGVLVTGLGVGFLEGSPYAQDPDSRNALERYLPMRRVGQPEEVAPAVIYLASDEAAFMTGQIMYLEGGAFSHI